MGYKVLCKTPTDNKKSYVILQIEYVNGAQEYISITPHLYGPRSTQNNGSHTVFVLKTSNGIVYTPDNKRAYFIKSDDYAREMILKAMMLVPEDNDYDKYNHVLQNATNVRVIWFALEDIAKSNGYLWVPSDASQSEKEEIMKYL